MSLAGLPWLSEDPTSGILKGGESVDVAVTFDTIAYPFGGSGSLIVDSNDPDTPQVAVGVDLKVYSQPMDMDFLWTPPNPMAGEELTFTATAQGAEPLSYTWAFGDGAMATGNPANHTYILANDYSVRMTVSNACGNVTAPQMVTVAANQTSMRVGTVALSAVAGRRDWTMNGSVLILDASESGVPKARVYVEWNAPDGATTRRSAWTNTQGVATFSLKARVPGEWRLCVTDVAKPGWTYDAGTDPCGSVVLGGAEVR